MSAWRTDFGINPFGIATEAKSRIYFSPSFAFRPLKAGGSKTIPNVLRLCLHRDGVERVLCYGHDRTMSK
jgi:hypothetical protein